MAPKSKPPVQSKLSFPTVKHSSLGSTKDTTRKTKVIPPPPSVEEVENAPVATKPTTAAEASRQLREEKIGRPKEKEDVSDDGPSAWEGWEDSNDGVLVDSSDSEEPSPKTHQSFLPNNPARHRIESSASVASSDEEDQPRPIKQAAKQTVTITNRRTSTGKGKKKVAHKSSAPPKRYPPLPATNKFKDIVKTKAFKDHYAHVIEQMDGDDLGREHQDTVIEVVLRVFDLTYEYGPCVGFSRMERWKRAAEFGLDPPEIIRDILSVDEEGIDNCIFQGMT